MKKTPRPFRLNVGFIAHQEVGYKREIPFEFEHIHLQDDLILKDFDGLVSITRTPQGLLVQGKFSSQTTMTCVRCLNDFTRDLKWTLTDLYAFNEKSTTESELLLPDDGYIDLEPLIREYALLEVPINPICRTGCNGLCMVCGVNLNEADCGHEDIVDDSPFAALRDMFEE